MAVIFISHSKRDAELVSRIQTILSNIGHVAIIEEFIPEEARLPIPYEEIRRNVQASDCVFLFLTDNIVATEYTRNWVMYEVGLASERRIGLFVFERQGIPILYPIPYLTDYMIFSPHDIDDLLEIQALARKIGQIPRPLITGGLGALLGAPFGPLGIVIGGLGGAILGSRGVNQTTTVKCPNCNVTFRYHSPGIAVFNCPACRAEIRVTCLPQQRPEEAYSAQEGYR